MGVVRAGVSRRGDLQLVAEGRQARLDPTRLDDLVVLEDKALGRVRHPRGQVPFMAHRVLDHVGALGGVHAAHEPGLLL